MATTFSDVACTVCGCVCDDLQVTVSDGCVAEARNACQLAKPWFASLAKPIARPTALIEGQAVPLEKAIERSVEILGQSRSPLIWGLTRSSTEGQRGAIALAEQLGGYIDTTTSCDAAATLAFQKVGQSSCSLGEIRNRADLVIFWGTNPVVSHPRHLERYSVDAKGAFVPGGRADRKVIVLDNAATETSRRADMFIEIRSGSELDVIATLRQLVVGEQSPTAAKIDDRLLQLKDLAQQMKTCQYGALFFGSGQAGAKSSQTWIEALLQLTTKLNKFTRFTAHYIPQSGGVTGAENVLCWQTGFPFAASFANGYPRFSLEEFSANRLLERCEADACVLVGSEGVCQLSPAAQETLRQLPTIVLDYPNVEPSLMPTVRFTTAIYGFHAPGTAYRIDGVPIPLRELVASTYPTDDEVLNSIAADLKQAV